MAKHVFSLFLLIVLIANIALGQETEWRAAKSKNGIEVFTREYPGSDIKEFKALTRMPVDIAVLERVIDHIEGYPEWQATTREARTLEVLSDEERTIYVGTAVPWPVKDRDLVLRQVKSRGPGPVIRYDLTSEPAAYSEQEDYIRIVAAKGSWQLRQVQEGETEVTYTFYADPEGGVPNWIINLFIVDGPFETLTNLHDLVLRK